MTDRRFINHHNLDQRGQLMEVHCRFCNSKQKYDKYDHVAPCGCAGLTRYVHRDCLQKWIIIKFQHVYNHSDHGDPQQFNVFCEVCQQRIEMEFVLTSKLSKYEDFVEKIISKKILFSALLLLAAGLIVLLIIFGIFYQENGESIDIIIGITLSSLGFAIVAAIFIWNFMIIQSIVVQYIANNKNPKIIGYEAQLQEMESEEKEQQQQQKDPYFGGEPKEKQVYQKSLMLQSRRDSGQSGVSKTFTDYIMKRMYKHDEQSYKGRSEKELSQRANKLSNYQKRQPVKETRDQEVQIDNIFQKQQSQQKMIQKEDKQVQKSVRQLDQQIQQSVSHFKSIRRSSRAPERQPQPIAIRKKGQAEQEIGRGQKIKLKSSKQPIKIRVAF